LHPPVSHYSHSTPGALQKPLFRTRLHSLSSLQSNRRHTSPPARGLDADGRAGTGCELEASTKAAPQLPVFAVLSPPPVECSLDRGGRAACITIPDTAMFALANLIPSGGASLSTRTYCMRAVWTQAAGLVRGANRKRVQKPHPICLFSLY